MLSDARSLWDSAAGAVKKFNDNITNALDNIDIDNIIDDGREESVRVDKLESELASYKKMLDEAQMQIYEVSKSSRMVLAEKDTELSFYKKNASPNAATYNADNADTSLQLEKAKRENLALEESLREVQERLKAEMHQKNEHSVSVVAALVHEDMGGGK